MRDADAKPIMSGASDYDAVVVGASLAGCTTALLLGRAGARVALVEQRESADAFKRICGHFIQSSAVPTLERAELLDAMIGAGAVRSRLWLWTRWGLIAPPPEEVIPPSVNLRRERLDPLVRAIAADQPGVELMLGRAVTALRWDGGRACGVETRDRAGRIRRIDATLVVGADGRSSKVAGLAKLPGHVSPHGRFSYAAYYEGPPPRHGLDGRIWMTDPDWAAAFPTDGGLTMYGCMPTKKRLPEFRRDLDAALTSLIAGLPDPPPIRESRRVSPILGKIEMPNVQRGPVAPGLALVGDAALATDPLWGVGCGWAFQSAEWLAESVAGALAGDEPLPSALRRYRRRFRRHLQGHALMIRDYATGRRFTPVERALFSAAVVDPRVSERLARFGTRNAGPATLLSPGLGARIAAPSLRRGMRARAGARRSSSDMTVAA